MAQSEQLADNADVLTLSPKGFSRLAQYVTSELGIKMPNSKMSLIQSRLVRRVRDLGLHSIEEYGEYLLSSGHDEERDHFINAITTNKTDFFREPEHYKYLVDVVMPSLHQNPEYNPRRMRVWSAACSSGEEPYTLAMVLSEYARLHTGFDFAILATDVSTKVLQKARRGIYNTEQVSPVSIDLRRRYLLQSRNQEERQVRIVPALRQKVSFHRLNFMASNYRIKERFEVIFLRNVLIYFDREIQQDVLQKVCSHLTPGGYLFVSHSESISEVNLPVSRVHTSVHRLPL